MSAQETINQKYQELAAMLADRMIKKEVLEEDIKTLRARIKGLEDHVPLILEIEKAAQEGKVDTNAG
jgi:myo-inositol-1-phosphate synthase